MWRLLELEVAEAATGPANSLAAEARHRDPRARLPDLIKQLAMTKTQQWQCL